MIWSLDVNDNIVPSVDVTDDDYSDQKLVMETISGCDEDDNACFVRLRFWFRDLCLIPESDTSTQISTQPCNIGDTKEVWEKRNDGEKIFLPVITARQLPQRGASGLLKLALTLHLATTLTQGCNLLHYQPRLLET